MKSSRRTTAGRCGARSLCVLCALCGDYVGDRRTKSSRYGKNLSVSSTKALFSRCTIAFMPSTFLLYGANGFVGREIVLLAVKKGLRPIVAGRDRASIESLATALGLEHRVFDLDHVAI